MKKFAHTALAGTFDHLHIGHKKLINETFDRSKIVSLGIADGDLLKGKQLFSQIQPFATRKKQIEHYLNKNNVISRTKFFPLSDIYGIAATDTTLEALFVTPVTLANAEKVNVHRLKKGLPKLDIVVIPLLKSTDGKIISSERIRAGEIDREGKLYKDIFSSKQILRASDEQRLKLRNPLGEVVGRAEFFSETTAKVLHRLKKIQPPFIIAIGDIIAWHLRQSKTPSDIEVIDLKSKRQKIEFPGLLRESALKATNEAGTVSSEFASQYQKAVERFLENREKSQIFVEGEEDLTALPAILLAPLGSVVLYGHFDLGVVLVEVTEQKKEDVKKIIKEFV